MGNSQKTAISTEYKNPWNLKKIEPFPEWVLKADFILILGTFFIPFASQDGIDKFRFDFMEIITSIIIVAFVGAVLIGSSFITYDIKHRTHFKMGQIYAMFFFIFICAFLLVLCIINGWPEFSWQWEMHLYDSGMLIMSFIGLVLLALNLIFWPRMCGEEINIPFHRQTDDY